MPSTTEATANDDRGSAIQFVVGTGRAFAGALIFALPMLMTMEMWWLGFTMDPLRLALLLVVSLPLLIRLSRFGGMRTTHRLTDDIADALVAVGVAFVASTVVLAVLGIVTLERTLRENIGMAAVQMVPASIGAMLAQNQLGEKPKGEESGNREPTYGGEIFLMVVGALFLSLNLAPTEEIILIGYSLVPWQEGVLLVLTLGLMHALVYTLEFGGTERPHPAEGFLSVFSRYTLVGYVAVFFTSLYVLWTFGRFDGTSAGEILSAAVVLSFPGAIGAAVARLIL